MAQGTRKRAPKVSRTRTAGDNPAKIVELKISDIRTDGNAQMRAAIDLGTVKEYAERISAGVSLPPIVVFHDGKSYWPGDGFHRLAAHQAMGKDAISCEIHQGTAADAVWYAIGANQTHGLRRTNADKEKAVKAALVHPAAVKAGMGDNQIALHVGVSHTTVAKYRAELELTCQLCKSTVRTGADGRAIDTSNIGGDRPSSAESAPTVYGGGPAGPDLPHCPKCGSTAFDNDDDCLNCRHPFGEPIDGKPFFSLATPRADQADVRAPEIKTTIIAGHVEQDGPPAATALTTSDLPQTSAKDSPEPAPATSSDVAPPAESVVVCDRLERPVPDGLRRIFTEVVQQIGNARRTVAGLRTLTTELAADQQAAAFLEHVALLSDLANVHHALTFAMPYAVCPYCRGDGTVDSETCGPCRGTGWVNKTVYNNTPKDLRE